MKRTSPACAGRRQFLYLTAGVATAGLGLPGLLFSDTTNSSSASSLRKVTKSTFALGSEISITALHADEAQAATAITDAFAELELIEQLMSIYREESQLSHLNRERVLRNPHPYFFAVLRAAEEMSRRSDGAFDITVQPLWSLFAESQRRGEIPHAQAIESARQRIDYRQVHLTDTEVRLDGEAQITLNGIAQGFAADRVEAALRNRGVSQALINTGEIVGLGTKDDGAPWAIGVQHPRQQDAYISLVDLSGRCLATSGDYATTFSEDRRHHHLLDPRTGHSPTELSSVSIVAKSALEADALSTAVFVLGCKPGLKLVQRTAGADAFLVLKNGRTFATGGFPFQA